MASDASGGASKAGCDSAKRRALLARAQAEAPLLRPRLEALRRLRGLAGPDACAAYVAAALQVRHGPSKWLGGRRKAPPGLATEADLTPQGPAHNSATLSELVEASVLEEPPEAALRRVGLNLHSTLREVLQQAQLQGQPAHAAECLEAWFAGRRPLELLWRVPSPKELLEMQAAGLRCVSALVSENALQSVFGHRDCLEMLVHDLSHAEKFVEGGRYWQQVGFFEFLRASVAPVHEQRWALHFGHRWRLAWQYVSSDMNSMSVHMLVTLKCQLMGAVARATLWREGLSVPGEDGEEEAAFEAAKADIYPKSASGAWRQALQEGKLESAYEAAFAAEWHGLIEAHIADVSRRFPDVLGGDSSPSGLPAAEGERLAQPSEPVLSVASAEDTDSSYALWPRPSADELAEAFEAIGTGRRMAWMPAERALEDEETGSRGRFAKALIAHFDELGRQKLRLSG